MPLATGPIRRAKAGLIFGAQQTGATTATRWLTPGNYAGLAPFTARWWPVLIDGTITKLGMSCIAGSGAATVTMTLWHRPAAGSPVATAVAMTFANTDTSAFASSFEFETAAGDLIAIAVERDASVASGQTDMTALIGYKS